MRRRCMITIFLNFGEAPRLRLTAQNRKSIMILLLECPIDEMLFINYEAPNGKKLHNRLWNGKTGFGTIKFYAIKREFS